MQPMRGLKLGVVFVAAAAFGQESPLATDPYEPIDAGEKFKLHLSRVYAPSGLAKSAFTAGYNHLDHDPPEWGQGMKGYGRRYGHKLLNRAVENAIGFTVVATLKEDPRYFYSNQRGVWRRLKHAVTSTFLTRTDSGGQRLSTWRFAGNYGAAFLSNQWRPESENKPRDALERGTLSIGFDVAANIFKEFWPDIKRRIRRR
jgi:hypothetical protein